jgi:hypothetical protein
MKVIVIDDYGGVEQLHLREFLRHLPAAPSARRNLCDHAAYAEPLFLERRSVDCRNSQ